MWSMHCCLVKNAGGHCDQTTMHRPHQRLGKNSKERDLMRFRILILALGTFAIGTDSFVIAGVLPDVARSLHISLTLAGSLITLFSLVYAFGAPVLATMLGHVERRRLLLGALVMF